VGACWLAGWLVVLLLLLLLLRYLSHLHAFWLHLLHHQPDVDLAWVLHVLLRLYVDLLDKTRCIDVVDSVLTVINVVVLALLQGWNMREGGGAGGMSK
jgi:hypothetical protein